MRLLFSKRVILPGVEKSGWGSRQGGKDVADLLDYTNAGKALSDHCKGVTKR